MRLFIAEKPSVARAIADALGVSSQKKGYIVCKDGSYVTNCFGHMLELYEPEDYLSGDDKKLPWAKQPLPIIPEVWKKKIKKGVKDQLNIIKDLLSQADKVVNAGDPDREGQLLVDEVIKRFKYAGTVERYWQSAMDKTSVQRALSQIVPNSTYANWGLAAEARSRADWLIGMNMTRTLTVKYNAGLLSVGRVQTPVLRLIVNRDLAIENHVAGKFFNILATFRNANGTYESKMFMAPELLDESKNLTDENKAKELLENTLGQKGTITNYTVDHKKEKPKLMFTLTDLSAECSSRFKFSAKKTLNIAQKLYEEYKLTSYPRSSCEYLPSSQKADVPQILANISQAFPEFAEHVKQANPDKESRVWNDTAVGEAAHTGIVPTLQAITSEKLATIDEDCRKVYELIVKRYLAAFMPDHEYDETSLATCLDNKLLFNTVVRNSTKLGWKELYKSEKKATASDDCIAKLAEQKLPLPIKEGDKVTVENAHIEEGKTKPPARFTEGSLMKAMKNIAKEIDDPEQKKLLKDDDGIGTEATRAQIIETLKAREYIRSEKGKLISTEKGRSFLTAVPEILQSASLTAQTERELRHVEKGEISLQDFITNQVKELKNFMTEANKIEGKVEGSKRTPCPACGGTNFWRNQTKDKKRYYWHCKDCGKYFNDDKGKVGKENTPATTENCPKCGKKVYRNERKDKKGFYWKCAGCGTFFDDDNGKLGAEHVTKEIPADQKATCPKCGKTAVRYEKNGKAHWWCRSCDTNFFDKDGTLGDEMVKQS